MKQIEAGSLKCSEGIFVYSYFYVRGGNRFPLAHTGSDRPRGPPIHLYKGYQFSFPDVMRPRRGVDHPPPSSGVLLGDLYLYKLL